MFERPRGTRDLKPEECVRRRHFEAIIRGVSERFGYGEVATPTFEHAELFVAKSGPGILDEMYVFKDKGGREIALRPELTAPVIRMYLAEMTRRPKPIKVYYIGNCFRYDEPQKGRYREFWQYGIEIIGGNPLDADSEAIATAMEVLREAGVMENLEVRIGHIGILRGLIEAPGDVKARILSRLDKRDYGGMRRELEAAGLGHLEGMLMKIVSLRGDQEILEKAREIVGNAGAAKALDYLGKLGEILNAYGIQGITYDLGVVRGLDYYNGMVFEVHHRPLGAASQVCGGGAYSLTEVFGGEPISTTGFGMGIDRVLLAMELESVQTPSSRFLAYVIPVGQSARLKAVAISMQLRRSGLAVDLDLVGRGPSKNLEYANSLKARYAILVGEAELARNAVAVRDLTSGDQQEVPIESLVSHLTHRV